MSKVLISKTLSLSGKNYENGKIFEGGALDGEHMQGMVCWTRNNIGHMLPRN